jgi:hypothetical protein
MSQSSPTTALSAEDLATAAGVKVFFGHQSVGMNVLDATPDLFAANGLPAPRIVEVGPDTAVPEGGTGGFLAHAYVGRNDEPHTKIKDLDARIRGGLGAQVDVALMKFCYADVHAHTDAEALFRDYRAAMTALERDFDTVTFLHVTTPLTTQPGLKQAVKRLLGRPGDRRADNVTRERLNRLVREEYGPDRVFDLAAVQSTAPDGTRVTGRYEGQEYFALYDGYAADPGHLNAQGSRLAAAGLLGLIARVAAR